MGDIEKDIEDLREATRYAHECTKDLKALLKEANETIDRIERAAAVQVGDRIDAALKVGLDALMVSIEVAIKDSSDRVYRRFDQVADILMGETKTDKRRGEPSLSSLAQQVRDLKDKGA